MAVAPKGKQAILTRQEHGGANTAPAKGARWILHLMHDGDYTVEVRRDYAAPTRITGRYPATGWQATLERTDNGIRIKAGGDAKDRLLVLE
jgi:hypothetical protein